jgi:hypothetical protein
MMRFGQWPSPTLGVPVMAPIMGLGGTGYAAIRLPANSVENKQLENGAVTMKKIARDAVTSANSANSTNNANLAREAGL